MEICVFEKLFEFLNTDAQQTVEGLMLCSITKDSLCPERREAQ